MLIEVNTGKILRGRDVLMLHNVLLRNDRRRFHNLSQDVRHRPVDKYRCIGGQFPCVALVGFTIESQNLAAFKSFSFRFGYVKPVENHLPSQNFRLRSNAKTEQKK